MQTELKFPEFLHDKKAKKLVEQLLSHNPSQRHNGSFESLKKHSWFDDFRWEGLVKKDSRRLKPPTIPTIREKSEKSLNIPLVELIKRL